MMPWRYTAEFKLRALTPILSAGSNPNIGELRAPSFKGLMRFWWRAVRRANSLKDLRREENELFGSTERASSVRIRVIGESKLRRSLLKRDFGYIFPFWRGMEIPEGTELSLYVETSSRRAMEVAIASLWLLINLGGIGKRWRRGAGALELISYKGELAERLFSLRGGNLREHLKQGLEEVNRIVNEGTSGKHLSSYSTLDLRTIRLSSELFESPRDAWKDIVNRFYEFRRKLSVRSSPLRGTFGLPNPAVRSNPRVNRRASPLVFKVLSFNGKYHWLAYRFSGAFLPEPDELKRRGAEGRASMELIDEFLAELPAEKVVG